MTKIPSNSELCKLDNQNQRLYKITKTEYNRMKNKIHCLWKKVSKEKQLLKKLLKQKRKAR